MNEKARLKKLLTDHYDGLPWIDISILGTLKKIPAARAAQQVGSSNSVWQIVLHMIAWREQLVHKLKGEPMTVSDSNFIETISDTSRKAWVMTLDRLAASQELVLKTLASVDISKKKKGNMYSNYEYVQAVLQHDAYHLGQIVLLDKLIRDAK